MCLFKLYIYDGRNSRTYAEYTTYKANDEVWDMGIKNRLKEIRMKEYMLNQKEFAALIDVLPDNYSRLENNKTQVSLERAIIIAKKLNKSVEDVFEVD